MESAQLVLDWAFSELGARRVEARSSSVNNRGNGALGKLGAERECVLRQSSRGGGRQADQFLWSLLASDWAARRAAIAVSSTK
jgi:RimJ/RimL family protein N-acetyltransferase